MNAALEKEHIIFTANSKKSVYTYVTFRIQAHVAKQEDCGTVFLLVLLLQRLWVNYACNLQEHCSKREVELLLSPNLKKGSDVVKNCTRSPLPTFHISEVPTFTCTVWHGPLETTV